MHNLYLLFFYLTTLQTTAQKTIPNSFFQLEQQDSLLPFYRYLKDGHFFFFCADEAQVQLLNYGEYKAEGEKLDFEPAIRAEGTLTVWELFSKDSIFCLEEPWFVAVDGDTVACAVEEKGVASIAMTSNITALPTSLYSVLKVKKDKKQKLRPMHSLERGLNTICYTQSKLNSFVIKDDLTGICSPKIEVSKPKPHLILVDLYFPRQSRVDDYEPFYFFPNSHAWKLDTSTQQIIAKKPYVVTFFDLPLSPFKTYFDSKNGLYQTKEWVFQKVVFDRETAWLEVLEKQKISYLAKRKPILPISLKTGVEVRVKQYSNLSVKPRKVRSQGIRYLEGT